MKRRVVLLLLAVWSCGGRASLVGGDDGSEATSAPTSKPDSGTPPIKGFPDASPPKVVPDANVPPLVCGSVTGAWIGTWKSNSGVAGTWETRLVESAGGALSGSSVVTGTQCGTTSTIVGKRAGCTISIGLSSFGGCTVEFVGTIEGSNMSGTFSVTQGLNDQGQWSGSKR